MFYKATEVGGGVLPQDVTQTPEYVLNSVVPSIQKHPSCFSADSIISWYMVLCLA